MLKSSFHVKLRIITPSWISTPNIPYCSPLGIIKSSNRIEVFFVDYGNMDQVAESDLRPMQPDFLRLEAQAIKCCLHGTDDPGAPWTDSLTKRFSEMVDGSVKVSEVCFRFGVNFQGAVARKRINCCKVYLEIITSPDLKANPIIFEN